MTKLINLALILFLSTLTLSACTQSSSDPSIATPTPMPPAPTSITQKTDLRQLMATNQNLKCSWDLQTTDSNSSGTVYISAGKSKIDSTVITSDGATVNSHTLIDGDYLYSWQSQSAQGMKINIKNYANSGNNSQSTAQSVDLDADYDYNCSPWLPQASDFEMPSSVQFTDLSETMENLKQDLRSVCDNLQGDAKAQCLQSLNQ